MIARWTRRYRTFVIAALLSLAVAGGVATFSVPVALFPHVEFPRVMISIEAGDRSAEQMEIQITRPVEEAVRAVPGVRNVRSRTSRGGAEISVGFDWGDDMVSRVLLTETAITDAMNTLPDGVTVNVRRMDPTVFPVLGFSLQSKHRSQVELRDLALYTVRPVFSALDGVGQVAVLGGDEAELQVWVEPEQLAANDLAPDDVASAIRGSGVLEATGRIEDHGHLYLVLTDSQVHNTDEVGSIVVRSDATGDVTVSDVARVVEDSAPRWTRVSADGRDAVIVQLYQQPDANTVAISIDAMAALTQLSGALPPDVEVHKWYDQSELITASAVSVRDAIIIGAVLAALVVFLFLRNLRITLVAVIVVVSTLAATGLCISVLGMSFNVMSLGGIAAAVGLVIDDAIVVVEHLVRRQEEYARNPEGPAPTPFTSAAEFTRPLLGSSLGTVIIFSPLAMITGVTGAFFRALSITMASALTVSFLVSWLGVPILVSWLHPHAGKAGSDHRSLLARSYAHVMRQLLRHPLVSALLLAAPLVGLGYHASTAVGSGFMPSIDEGGFVLDYHAEWGTSLAETDRMASDVEAILREIPEVDTTSRRTGVQLGGALTEANEGDIFVKLKPLPRRGIQAIMEDVRQRVEARVPGLEIEMALLMEDLIGDLLGVPQPIEVKLYGNDESALAKAGPAVASALDKIDGVVDIEDGQIIAGNALVLKVDPIATAREGMQVQDVSDAVAGYLDGIVATHFHTDTKMVNVRVVLPHVQSVRQYQLDSIRIRAPDGHSLPLSRVAHFEPETGQPQIMHENMSRMTAVTARLSGLDLGSAVEQVRQTLATKDILPKGVTFRMGGLYAEQQAAFRSLTIVVAVASVLVLLLLLFMYRHLGVALAALGATLLSLPAVFLGLWLTGTELNITAMMGMVMILGMASEVSIFCVSEVETTTPEDDSATAHLIAAGISRTRPIAMMKAAAVLSLLPLAIGIGEGVGMLTPLAIAIISGLLVQLPIGIVVLPCLMKGFAGSWCAGSHDEEPADNAGSHTPSAERSADRTQ